MKNFLCFVVAFVIAYAVTTAVQYLWDTPRPPDCPGGSAPIQGKCFVLVEPVQSEKEDAVRKQAEKDREAEDAKKG